MHALEHARLHLPATALGGVVFLGAERDTRGTLLSDAERFNYYPATPFATLSWIFSGTLHMVEDFAGESAPRLGPPLSRVLLSGPQRHPTVSWSPGAVHALSVACYPDALCAPLNVRIESLLDETQALQTLASGALATRLLDIADGEGSEAYAALETALRCACPAATGGDASHSIRAWMQAMAVRAAFSTMGVGLRQAQRRIKQWTGQSQRDLKLYARTEEAMARVALLPADASVDFAALAAGLGYADQSHLGREVRRVTGVAPGRLEALIESDEAFWFYRLMQAHMRRA